MSKKLKVINKSDGVIEVVMGSTKVNLNPREYVLVDKATPQMTRYEDNNVVCIVPVPTTQSVEYPK